MEVIIHEATGALQNTSNGNSAKNGFCTEKNDKSLMALSESSQFVEVRDQSIDIQFENVSYTASIGWRKEQKEILHQVNGRFPAGQLIAIMGPSGAGKSTLLDVLSGYRIKGVSGVVRANGVPRNLKAFRKSSCYITQDDRLQPLLTVGENMQIAADLKLPCDVGQNKKQQIIKEILLTLGLLKTINTKALRLSGGQKKRLSIALELINNPVVMFLDEPTTGLDSSSCKDCVQFLKVLANQGRTIICTIHQPSASLFQLFDIVYVLSSGNCLYQGTTNNLVKFLQDINCPCPKFHNPADFVIELACGEHGNDKIEDMIRNSYNGKSLEYYEKPEQLPNLKALQEKQDIFSKNSSGSMQATSSYNQLKVLLRRGYIKAKRDMTLTYLRIGVNALVALLLSSVYWQAGNDGSKVLDNYSLLFAILIHHLFSTMMLTILTFPSEMLILIKEHFNRWYSLKTFFLSVNFIDLPVTIASGTVFSVIIYYLTAQPIETERFVMFLTISLLVCFVAQSFGLAIGAIFSVVNGTFIGPALAVPAMMFAGFGVTLKDLPPYLYWGSYISYLKYALEGYVHAIYGNNRDKIECNDDSRYCYYRYTRKFLRDVAMKNDQFYNDVIALLIILFFLRMLSYVLLRVKLMAVR